MWNSQSDGVGHFSRYVEERTARSNPDDMVRQLSGEAQGGQNGASGQTGRSDQQSGGEGDKGTVKDAAARRVYDAPDKGVLWGRDVGRLRVDQGRLCGGVPGPILRLGFRTVRRPPSSRGPAGRSPWRFSWRRRSLLVSDLTQPWRFVYVLLRPQWKSWLVLGGYALTLYGLALTLWAAAMLTGQTEAAGIIGWGTAVLAVLAAVYTAFLFAQAKGRDFWQSPMLVLHMLLHAVLAGAAVFAVAFLFRMPGEAWTALIRNTLIVAVILNLLVIAAEMLTPHPTADARKTVQAIVRGRYRGYFWIAGLLVGNLFARRPGLDRR